jgi:disulfide oxidoreductase YuzD
MLKIIFYHYLRLPFNNQPFSSMTKFLFIIFCLFISLLGYNQTTKTVILDSTTNAPIAFVRVSIPGSDTYLLSNSKGEIVLDSLWMKSNTLSVFCYGYVRKTISKSQTTILLSPSFKELKESKVVVSKRRYGNKKLGEEDHPTPRDVKSDHGFNILTGNNGELRSVWIPNEKSLKGYLEKVNVFILAMGNPSAFFRIHFYACSKLKLEPGEEITSQNIIANGTTGNEWVTVDVSSLRIPLSENGIFVGIEWFDNEVNTSYTDTLTFKINYVDRGKVTEKRVFKGNGCVIGLQYDSYRKNKHKNWDFKNQNWSDIYIHNENRFYKPDTMFKFSYTRTPDNLHISVPCINVDVKYIKQKNESEFEDPKKRKLNRIEKVKEDEFLYPQNTVSELFNSLVKAIEKNELVYALKYLCVYKDDQFGDILDDVKQWEGKLPPIEQQTCLRFLRKLQQGTKEENIKHLEGNEYELNVDGEIMYLLHEKGKWKINPYSYRFYNPATFHE